MFQIAEIFLQKSRLFMAGIAAIGSLLFICLLAPVVHASAPADTAQLQAATASQKPGPIYDDANAVSRAFTQSINYTSYYINTAGVNILSGTASTAAAITRFDLALVHGTQTAVSATIRGTGTLLATTVHGISTGVIYSILGIGKVFGFTGHLIGSGVGAVSGITHLSSVVAPGSTKNVPVIVLRQRQAALIQKDTTGVIVAANTSSGGACDAGNGNGAYPAVWCNAPMDTLPTVAYTSDRINRECTSYAYWYFTSIEGHSDFHVTGDAKYWANTTNYPVHSTPAIGAIAVENAGAYGHVAIVHALPGQDYAGQIVPAGNVLVSEMNYDWQGHFRYSFSPISKFSAFIY
jgi:hypothetical protein